MGEKAKVYRVAMAIPVSPPAEISPLVIAKTFTGGVQLEGSPGNRLTIVEQDITFEDCQSINSAEEAEDLLLAIPPIRDVVVTVGTPEPTFIGGDFWTPSALPLHINRAANLIAARSRRGPGQVCLMSSKMFETLREAPAGVEAVEDELVGRWTKKAIVNGAVNVYVGDFIPDNEVFVAYVGSGQAVDGPGEVLEKDGALGFYLLKDTSDALGNATDYVQRFRVMITNP
jgi:hypothetical protein